MKKEEVLDERMKDIKAQSIVYIYESVFKDFIYKGHDMEKFYEQIREMLLSGADFFVEWFKGFVFTADFDFENAKKQYLLALKYADSAREYLTHFLQQGFALFMYLGQKDEAVEFWNFGEKKGIFAKADERLFSSFISKEQFWVQFNPKMFNDSKKAEECILKDYKKSSDDELKNAIDSFDYKKFSEAAQNCNFDTRRIDGVSVLYYVIQRNGALLGGVQKFTDDLISVRTGQMLSTLDFSSLSEQAKQSQYLTIIGQLRSTYEKSGLARLMFVAANCEETEIEEKKLEMKKILSFTVENTSKPDDFCHQIDGRMAANALYVACELDDAETVKLLLNKGCNPENILGYADFGMKYGDGTTVSTKVPNTLIYRLISFKAWETLKMYLSEYPELAEKSMTEKSEKCNITPLVYFILNTIYTAVSEDEFNQNKNLVDGFIPLFQNAGSVLDENTAFGKAKKLLGMK